MSCMACCGDIPTLEISRGCRHAPRRRCRRLKVRVVNVVDLMRLFSPRSSTSRDERRAELFVLELFTRDIDVCFSLFPMAMRAPFISCYTARTERCPVPRSRL